MMDDVTRPVADGRRGEPTTAPRHRVPLEAGWSLWRGFCVRGAGFPVELIRSLVSKETAAAADALLALEARLADRRAEAIVGCKAAVIASPEPASRRLRRLQSALEGGHVPVVRPDSPPEVREVLRELAACAEAVEVQKERARVLYGSDCLSLRHAARALAGDARFREAVTWQNRLVVDTALDNLLRKPVDVSNARTREKEMLIANYLQRYCVKNESIGFFGPIVWGSFAEAPVGARVRCGADLVSKRTVYFEHWAIAALASSFAAQPGAAMWMAPRRHPIVHLDGLTLLLPFGSEVLSPVESGVLRLCDGERSALSIANEVVADETLGVNAAGVYSILESFVAKGLLLWGFEIPTQAERFEDVLRDRLLRIENGPLRDELLRRLGRLEEARDVVSRAAGDPGALGDALAGLDGVFTELTGKSPSRSPGQTCAGRTLVYETCVRDLSLELGDRVLGALRSPLTLLLESYRYYSFEKAALYQEEFLSMFRTMREALGTDRVSLVAFWGMVATTLPENGGEFPPSVLRLKETFQASWSELLGDLTSTRRVSVRACDIAERAGRVFRAPRPGWPSAKHHSPDIMIAADGLDAIERGDYRLVLGELHPTNNQLEQLDFVRVQSDGFMLEALDEDFPDGRVSVAVPTDASIVAWVTSVSCNPKDLTLEFEEARSGRPRAQTISVGDLFVVEEEGRLVIYTRDLCRRWEGLEVLDNALSEENVPMVAAGPHTPRISIDQLVVHRETWRLESGDLPFVAVPDAFDRFCGARRWARWLGIPRHAFFKVAGEKKPCYVDFDSIIYVENFTKMVRKSSRFSISEMLPTPDQCWLTDADSNSYSSELRLVAVDEKSWRIEGSRGANEK